jgi:hypothetical protein
VIRLQELDFGLLDLEILGVDTFAEAVLCSRKNA